MAYFPFFIDIEEKPGLIVGGGMVAYRKARALTAYCKNLTVVAQEFCDAFSDMEDVQKKTRAFSESDLDGKYFVVAATDDSRRNAQIAQMCRDRQILVNSVDDIDNCDYIFPSLIKEKDITIGISTSGQSPLYAKKLRERMEPEIKKDAALVAYLGSIRTWAKETLPSEKERMALFARVDAFYETERCLPSEEMLRQWANEVLDED